MPTVREIEQALYEFAPKGLAAGWDNVGLLVGEPEQAVNAVLVALDVTQAVAEEAIAKGCDLIVAHHPIMNCKWLPVQTVRGDTPQGRLLSRLLRAEVSVICMHTNLDTAAGGVNDALAAALRVNDPGPLDEESGIGRVGELSEAVPLAAFLETVKTALRPNGIRYVDGGRDVRRVAVGGGSCGDFVSQALERGCDTFVTADLGYHQFLDAVPVGLNLIDAGHFPTENVVCPVVAQRLEGAFPGLPVVQSAVHGEVIQYYV